MNNEELSGWSLRTSYWITSKYYSKAYTYKLSYISFRIIMHIIFYKKYIIPGGCTLRFNLQLGLAEEIFLGIFPVKVWAANGRYMGGTWAAHGRYMGDICASNVWLSRVLDRRNIFLYTHSYIYIYIYIFTT